jgi:DNA-damage-inducible protein J
MTTVVRARIDEEIKEKVADILKESGLTISDAIRITLNRIVKDNDFALIPNALTAKVIREGRKGKNLHKVDSVKELFNDDL